MTEEFVITPTIPGLREYPPLIFTWQKWPMRLERLLYIPGKLEIVVSVFYERDRVVQCRRYSAFVTGRHMAGIRFDENGPTDKSIESYFRIAHLSISVLAARDDTIQAFKPGASE